MQLMQDIAKKHGLTCLLHEKPFAGINGSGKHNNWSVVTNDNINLFSLGNDPINNIPFLATLACIVKGVDEYADLLRLAIATPSNDHRLGGNEAPSVIVVFFCIMNRLKTSSLFLKPLVLKLKTNKSKSSLLISKARTSKK